MRVLLLLSLSLLSACSSDCLTDCGLRSDTADCADLQRAEEATVRGYAEVNAKTCPYLSGYVVIEYATATSPSGRAFFTRDDLPGWEVYGDTDCEKHGIRVASLDVLPHEVGHVLTRCDPLAHAYWPDIGFSEAEAVSREIYASEPTGSSGATP